MINAILNANVDLQITNQILNINQRQLKYFVVKNQKTGRKYLIPLDEFQMPIYSMTQIIIYTKMFNEIIFSLNENVVEKMQKIIDDYQTNVLDHIGMTITGLYYDDYS